MIFWALALIATAAGAAEGQSVSPYLDSIKKQLESETEAGETGAYLEREQRKIRERDAEKAEDSEYVPAEGYSEKLRRSLAPAPQGSSYSDEVKRKLQPKESGGAIQAFREGRSQLEMKREGDINNAIGFRVGAGVSYDITTSTEFSARAFESVYDKFPPDLSFFYEYQPFHSEWFGNFGIVGGAGVIYHRGVGRFAIDLGNDFPRESRTKFAFWQIPVTAGVNYRFNLLRVLRPYVFVGPTLIGFIESRSEEGKSSLKGYSTSLQIAGGVSILLDWMSPSSAWDLYQQWSIKHYYLSIEYSKLSPLTGPVRFSNSGITVGMTFEY